MRRRTVSKPLVIVESPTKVKTIKKYVGDRYNVASTVGHIKDLPEKEIGIDIENHFEPKYVTIPGKQKVIKALKDAAGDAEDIFLAPDPDREGEAIAWHVAEAIRLDRSKARRVTFSEITRPAIQEAFANPRDINLDLVDAQQARPGRPRLPQRPLLHARQQRAAQYFRSSPTRLAGDAPRRNLAPPPPTDHPRPDPAPTQPAPRRRAWHRGKRRTSSRSCSGPAM